MKSCGHQRYGLWFAIGIFLITAWYEPVWGETRLQTANGQTANVEKEKITSNFFTLFPTTNEKHLYFSLADGFILCEFLTLQNARLNIYYTRKDISSRSVLDMKRFYLGIKLDF